MKKLPYNNLLCPRSREADVRAFDAMCARRHSLSRAPILRLMPSPGALEAARDARRAEREAFELAEAG